MNCRLLITLCLALVSALSCSGPAELPTSCDEIPPTGSAADFKNASPEFKGVKVGVPVTCEETGAYIPLRGSGHREIVFGRAGQELNRGSQQDFTRSSTSIHGVEVGTPVTCKESRGAYIPLYGPGSRKIVFGHGNDDGRHGCSKNLETLPDGECPEIQFEAFSALLSQRLQAKGIETIGSGMGTCGELGPDPNDFSTWNVSLSIPDWRQADAAIEETAALMNLLQIGDEFGISVQINGLRGCSTNLETLQDGECPEVQFDAFSALLSTRLAAKGITTIGSGMGTCGELSSTKDDFSTWNVSVSIHDWRQTDATIEEAAALMNALRIGGVFGISVKAIPCGIPL